MNLFNSKPLLVLTLVLYCATANAQTQVSQTKKNVDQVLEVNRKKIDSLDNQLVKTLGERERVVKEIGIYKAKNNIPPLQADRFKQVLQKGIEEGREVGLSETFITELLNAIHKESLRIEEKVKNNK